MTAEYRPGNPGRYAILLPMDVLPKLLLIPVVTGFLAQAMKMVVETAQTKRFDLRTLNTYGGMPSSHTAFVVSLATVIGLSEGIFSPAFAIAAVVAVITIRDAIGFRWYLSEHAEILNKLIAELPSREKPKFPRHILERIGHRPSEAFAGGLIGIALSILLWLILP